MKKGYVDAFVDKMAIYGSAGVGKTCTMSVVAGEDPPDVRTSTPIATRPVTMIQMQESGGKWIKYKSKQRMWVCAHISKHILGKELIDTLSKLKHKVVAKSASRAEGDVHKEETVPSTVQEKQPYGGATQESHDDATTQPKPSTASQPSLVDPEVLQVIHNFLDEMFELIDKCPETEDPITYIHKLLISDCGGQPQFHEVLPIFLKKMSMIVFVFKLSEEFSNRPMIEYYEQGKPLGTPYESDHTTEQLILQGLQSLHSHRSSKEKGSSDVPQIVMIGTHKDKENMCQESREIKNQKLREMLLPTFKKEIVYYQERTNDVLFPWNARFPGDDEKEGAGKIRSKVSSKRQSDPRQLPLQWLALEIILDEITQKLKRGVLSRNECLEVVRRLHLDESALEAALICLDELSLIFYYPEILPEVVFTNPQVLLDKISELVKVHHDIVKCSPDCTDSESWQEFFNHALITFRFLSQDVFNKHYVPGLFEREHLMKLFRRQFIFADFMNGKCFVPCLLRMLGKEDLSKERTSDDSLVAPFVLHFPDGPARRGIFCALSSFLTSPENHFPGPWKLKMSARSVTPNCLHRNCIQFTIPQFEVPCSVTLVDSYHQFELHLFITEQPSPDVCTTIKEALFAGLRKANITLGYTNSTPSFALLCPCGSGDPHPAKIGKTSWICTLDEGVGQRFLSKHLFWTQCEGIIIIAIIFV